MGNTSLREPMLYHRATSARARSCSFANNITIIHYKEDTKGSQTYIQAMSELVPLSVVPQGNLIGGACQPLLVMTMPSPQL